MQQYAYSAFGKIELITDQTGADVTDAPPIENSYAFTGREYDSESGCYYYRARYYCPEMKRFISEDPIMFYGGFTNFYLYAANNSISLTDPRGTTPQLAAIGIGAVAVGLGSAFGKYLANVSNGADAFSLAALEGTGGSFVTGALVGGFAIAGAVLLGPAAEALTLFEVLTAKATFSSTLVGGGFGLLTGLGLNTIFGLNDALGEEVTFQNPEICGGKK